MKQYIVIRINEMKRKDVSLETRRRSEGCVASQYLRRYLTSGALHIQPSKHPGKRLSDGKKAQRVFKSIEFLCPASRFSFSVIFGLESVLLLELEVLLPEGVDCVDHDLHQLHLGVAQAVLVGDVVGATDEAA